MESLKFFEVAVETGFFLHSFGLERHFNLNAWWVTIGLVVVIFGIALGLLINFELSSEFIVKNLNLELLTRKYTLVHFAVTLGYGIVLSYLMGIVYSLCLKVKRNL
jgi:hypothetical protein